MPAASPLSPRIDLLVDGVWTDITSDVRDQGVRISRGRSDEQSTVSPSRASLVVDNRDGRYSPRNPLSPLYGKIGRNTQLRTVVESVWDDYGRTASSGWGTADSGQAWTRVNGDAADFAVNAGVGKIDVDTVSSIREVYLADVSAADVTVSAIVAPGAVATGGSIDLSLTLRRTDASNYYFGVTRFNTDSTVDLLIVKRVAGVNTLVEDNDATGITYDANTRIALEFTAYGEVFTLTAWDADDPAAGVATVAEDSDTALAGPGAVGCRAILSTGNNNSSPVTVAFDRFRLDDVRHVGEVTAWPPRWDVTGRDVWVPVDASGILRRLGQGGPVVRSPLYQYLSQTELFVAQTKLGYWPLEDGANATRAANVITEDSPANVVGAFQFASAAGPDGSADLPDVLTTGRITAIPLTQGTIAIATGWWVMCIFKGSGTSASVSPMEVKAAGDLQTWRVTITDTAATLNAYGRAGDLVSTATIAGNYLDDEWHVITVWALKGSAFSIQVTLYMDDTANADSSANSHVLGIVRRVIVPGSVAASNMSSAQVGHVLVHTGNPSTTRAAEIAEAMNGFPGETAANRMIRLCAEADVPLTVLGDPDDTSAVGPQRSGGLLGLLQEAADVDLGILYEPRHTLGLAYRTRVDLLNQSPTLELDYAEKHIVPPFEPQDDDLYLRNDVSVSRRDGGSARYTVTDGPLSTAEPPDGVGIYDESIAVNAHTDTQLIDIAGWRANQGTWDEARYPSVTVELVRPEFTADAAFTAAAGEVDLGDIVTVENLPSWLPPDDAVLMAQGYTETISQFRRGLQWNASPGGLYTVAVWDDEEALWDTAYSSLASDFDAGTDTSMSVATESGRILWTTGAVDFDVAAGGVRLHVTNIAGGSSPQTFTVDADPVNGVEKTIPAGTQVRLWRPARFS